MNDTWINSTYKSEEKNKKREVYSIHFEMILSQIQQQDDVKQQHEILYTVVGSAVVAVSWGQRQMGQLAQRQPRHQVALQLRLSRLRYQQRRSGRRRMR